MTQKSLPFQYEIEKTQSGLTGLAGLPLYLELASRCGLVQAIETTLNTRTQGWSDTEMILSLILLNLAGGDCISDIERLESDAGLRRILQQWMDSGMSRKQRRCYKKRWRKPKSRCFPSNAAIHRYLADFHSPEALSKRVVGEAFIPEPNQSLQSLMDLNQSLIDSLQRHAPTTQATLDQDATLTETYKHEAYYCYKKFKAYQPLNTYWVEHEAIIHSEFRDGNVPAGYQQLRVLQAALARLPEGVQQVYIRSDSAGYQQDLLEYCAEGQDGRFGVIEFAISARVTGAFKQAVSELAPEAWQVLYREEADGSRVPTPQEWAEVCFVPNWAGRGKKQATYRYLAIREAMDSAPPSNAIATLELPFQTLQVADVHYKLFSIVTNRDLEGNTLIQWHRARCGKSEAVHYTQKEELAGGQLPSNRFGVNAAWWHIMILAFNLNGLMQKVALPEALKARQMKALRFHVIQIPGRVISHARQLIVRVQASAYELYTYIHMRIKGLVCMEGCSLVNDTS